MSFSSKTKYIQDTSHVPKYIPRNETELVESKHLLTSISHAIWFLDNSSTIFQQSVHW